MEIPHLNENQFAVGKAQYSTGIVLRNDGAIYQTGQSKKEMYEIFESYLEAEIFVLKKIKDNPDVECWIVNSGGEHVITYDCKGERKFKKS